MHGELQLASDLVFDGARVGALSEMDYDTVNKDGLLVSDDRCIHGPARLYGGDSAWR